MVLQHLHNNMGHLGVDRTIDLVRARFYWPKMYVSVERMISMCERCVRRKCKPERAAPLMNIQTNRPLELVCIDYLSIEPDQSNTKDVLVITDHFTKFAVAVPTPNQRARTVAKALWENFIVHYGIPDRLLSDQGPDFESKTISELCEITGMKKIRTTPYHPRSNPVERFNRTLLQMLGTLGDHEKLHWKEYVKPLVHAYNCTKNDVTGYSPYELMFGRRPRLPIDLAFGLPVDAQKKSHSQYVSDLKQRLEESFKIATSNAQKNAQRNKAHFDKQVVDSTLDVGDRVLVRNVKLRGKHKLANRWEDDVYVVLRKAGELPVYTVKPEGKQRPVRTLHRDLLLPCSFIPATDPMEKSPQKSQTKRKTRHSVVVEDDNGEDLESEYLPIPTWIPVSSSASAEPPEMLPALVVLSTEDANRPLSTECDDPTEQVNPTECDDPTEQVNPTECDDPTEQVNVTKCDNLPEREKQVRKIVESENLPDCPYLLEPCSQENGNPVDDPVEENQQNDEQILPSETVTLSECPDGFPQETVITEQPGSLGFQNSSHETQNLPRRSQRSHGKPERLQYSRLGNPLLYVVNAVFSSLNEAITSSMPQLSHLDAQGRA
uniref:Gypsy retrotransposon integrase-like protein 1 n=1 Tax=Amphiprion percula TaxID=161767 RepID=A0A3P8TL91_AMPPE